MSGKLRAIMPEPTTPMSFTLQNSKVDDFAFDQSVLREWNDKGSSSGSWTVVLLR